MRRLVTVRARFLLLNDDTEGTITRLVKHIKVTID